MNSKPKFILVMVLVVLLAYVPMVKAQKLPAGPQVLTFFSSVDDTEQPYGLYLPKNYDPNKKYPLVIMLHGAGSNHRLSLRRVFGKSNAPGESDVEASRYFPEWKDVDYIVASPYARGTMGYQSVAEKDVWDVLADVKGKFSVDEDRTYLTGLSMGGGGTLWIGLTRPDVWAAIAPVCPAPPKGTEEMVGNALNIPAHFFHGDQDPVVPVKVSRDWVQNLKSEGAKVEYIEFPGVQHNSWEKAYKDEFIFDWFSQFKRDLFPEKVKFASSQYKYNKAYWVRLDEITPGTLAKIDAEFTGGNQIMITSENLSAFTLQLNGHPKYNPEQVLQLVVNGKKLKTSTKDSITVHLFKGKWVVENLAPKLSGKRKGAEGPIEEAFSDRHIYVYGTGGNPNAEEVKSRAKLAEEAATWSVYRGSFLGRIMVFPRVISDKEVRPSDLESANLVLFGTKETNSIIQELSDKLPLHLDSAAKDYGLFYIFPLNGHYVAVNSGLPWWKGAETTGFRFTPAPLGILSDFKDYVFFKDSLKNTVSEGFFDKNWKLSKEDVQSLKSSGHIQIKQ